MGIQGNIKNISSSSEAMKVINSGEPSVIVVYAPWCKFCQDMEEEFNEFAKTTNIGVYKFRGDELRDFVRKNLNTESFPTVNFVDCDGSLIKYKSDERTVKSFKSF